MESDQRDYTVTVKNKDIPLLADILSVMQEVKAIEARREWQRERMFQITRAISGMPGGGNAAKGLDDALARLSELDEKYALKVNQYLAAIDRANTVLDGIKSQTMRSFVLLRYAMDMSDTQVRRELNMSRRSFERARRCVEDAENMAAVKWREKYKIHNSAR